jgi:hypothetical protein
VVQQNQQAKSTAAYEEQQSENDLKAYQDNQAQTGYANEQARQSASQQEYQNNLKARAAMSTARAQASEAGVEGNSVDALLADLSAQRDNYNQSVEQNYSTTVANNNTQLQNNYYGTQSALNSLRSVDSPNYLEAASRLGSSALGAYSTQLRANSGSTTVTPNGS